MAAAAEDEQIDALKNEREDIMENSRGLKRRVSSSRMRCRVRKAFGLSLTGELDAKRVKRVNTVTMEHIPEETFELCRKNKGKWNP